MLENVRFLESSLMPKTTSCFRCSQDAVPRESRHSSLMSSVCPIVLAARRRASAESRPWAVSSRVSASRVRSYFRFHLPLHLRAQHNRTHFQTKLSKPTHSMPPHTDSRMPLMALESFAH